MSIESTIEKMNSMKLFGMARILTQTSLETICDLTQDELLALLIDAEQDQREGKRLQRLLRLSGLKSRATLEQLDFSTSRGMDKNLLRRLGECLFIQRGESICITGPTGAGKSFLAQVLGNEACARGLSVQYHGFVKLMNHLRMGRADHSYEKRMAKLHRTDLLILDDFGLEALDQHSRLSFYEILEERYDRKSFILVSQVPVKSWHGIIGEPTIADAICDRLTNGSHMIQLKGDSYRRKKGLKSE